MENRKLGVKKLRQEMKKDFEKDLNKKRDDSPLRWRATVHCSTTHKERIHWLRFENEYMFGDLLTAKLFVNIATLKYNSKEKVFTNLKEYKAIKEAEEMWQYCLEEKQRIWDIERKEWQEEKKLKLVEDHKED